MPIYRYTHSGLIDRMEISPPRRGVAQATIIAKENITAEQLERLRVAVAENGFSTLKDTVDGRAAIQVRGMRKEKDLLAAIEKMEPGITNIERETTPDDLAEKRGYRDAVRDQSLFLSAIFYDIGNAAFFASGIMRGRHNKNGRMTPHDKSELMIGAAFSAGDVLMTMYGKHRGDEELQAVNEGLTDYLEKKGIELPEADALTPETLYETGIAKATNGWMRRHIIHIKCLSEFAGGLFTIHSATKPGNRNNGKLAAGMLISSGWLATFLLDDPPGHSIFDGSKPKPSNIAEIMMDNPRKCIAQPLAMGNNLANLWGSLNPVTGERARFRREIIDAQKQVQTSNTPEAHAHLAYTINKQHDYAWNVLSAGSFLIAHSLFGLSGSKRPEETKADKQIMDDLVLLSANMLAQQQPEVREVAIQQTAAYVSELSHVTMSEEQLAGAIRHKIESINKSTWATRVQAPLEAGHAAAV